MDRERRRIALTGASGLVGAALRRALESRGDEVWSLVRREAGARQLSWDPASSALDTSDWPALDAVVHLAGEPIAAGRWSTERKQRIRESRVFGTRLLSEALASLPQRPRALVCASATGYYGERGDEPCVEDDPPGEGFLPQVCVEWEAATSPASEAGIRTSLLRIGMVLSTDGGALERMLPVFRMGLGGPLGSGKQYWNWISLDDMVRVILEALDDGGMEGVFNAVAPEPLSSRDFARELGRALGRPAFMPAPAFAVRAVMGELADALLFTSTRAVPQALLQREFAFRHPTLAGALDELLG